MGPWRSGIFPPHSLIGEARLYERHLRDTDQWVAYRFFLDFVLPTLGHLAGKDQADFRHLTSKLVKRAIVAAAAQGDQASA